MQKAILQKCIIVTYCTVFQHSQTIGYKCDHFKYHIPQMCQNVFLSGDGFKCLVVFFQIIFKQKAPISN